MNEIAETQPKGLRAWFAQNEVRVGIKNALGGWMDENSFIAQLLISLHDQNLDGCTDQSKFEAAHECAALGMLPSLGQVALIPRNMRDKGRCVTVMPQWQGFQALMLRNQEVLDVSAELVHINDEYEYDPTRKQLKHKYDPFDEDRQFNSFDDIRGGYMVVLWKDEKRPPKFHFVSKETMIKARDCSPDFQRNGPTAIWNKWFKEQCYKTVYRNAYARRVVPIDPLVAQKMEKIIAAEDKVLENDPNRVGTQDESNVIDGEIVQRSKSSRSDQVAESMGKKKAAPQAGAEAPPSAAKEDAEKSVNDHGQFSYPANYHEAAEDAGDLFHQAESKAKPTPKTQQKVVDPKDIYRTMQAAIEADDPAALNDVLEMLGNSLDAGVISEDQYQMWKEKTSVALEQAVPH